MMNILTYIPFTLIFGGVCFGEVIDLSHEFSNETVYWPGFRSFKLENVFRGVFQRPDGDIWIEVEDYSAASHGGTHMDAPSHIKDSGDAKDQWTLEEIPVEKLFGPLAVINVKDKAKENRDYEVQVSDLKAYEEKYGRIPNGAFVVMHSGWGAKWTNKWEFWGAEEGVDWDEDVQLSFPGFSTEAADWLGANRRIHAVGVDTPSLDYGKSTSLSTHRAFFRKNIFGLENLANVHKLPEKGATIIALPIKTAGAGGGPCRVIVLTGDDSKVLNNSPAVTGISTVLITSAMLLIRLI